MTQLISNVLMQSRPDAIERPMTLIEKLEKEVEYHLNEFRNAKTVEYQCQQNAKIVAYEKAIDIVKQHQAENGWISADERLPTENDGRVSWGVNAYKKYILVNMVSRGVVGTCRFNLTDKCFETADKVTHWMPMPNLPSEVKNDNQR